MDQFEEVERELAGLAVKEAEVDSAGQGAMKAIGQLRRNRDRSFIVRAVAWLYVGTLGLTILFLLFKGLCRGDDNAFSNLSDLVKVAVLPVVTLVIGYYFGTEKSE
jgi:hypothetical protein